MCELLKIFIDTIRRSTSERRRRKETAQIDKLRVLLAKRNLTIITKDDYQIMLTTRLTAMRGSQLKLILNQKENAETLKQHYGMDTYSILEATGVWTGE